MIWYSCVVKCSRVGIGVLALMMSGASFDLASADPIVEFNFNDKNVVDVRGGVSVNISDVEGFGPGISGSDGAIFGTLSHVEAAAAINRDTSFTVSGWFRPSTVRLSGQSPHALVTERNVNFLDSCAGSISCANFGVEIYEGEFAFEVSTGDSVNGPFHQTRLTSNVAPVPDQLYHVVAVYDQDQPEIAIYIDGQLVGTSSVRAHLKSDTQARLRLARNGGAPNQNIQFYDGLMDDILIYDRALGATEISSLFEDGSDSDGDGVPDDEDICPGGDDNVDADADAVPDFCDPCPNDAENDADGDGVCGDVDVCALGDDNANIDGDSLPDACDVCPIDAANDADGDGFCESVDNCSITPNADQIDTDSDGDGDACDADDDNDSAEDGVDNCPLAANINQADTDGDGAGDVCDTDDDNDGVLDANDQCVATPNGEVTDAEGCGISQLCPCEGEWKNHGAYVRCVAQTAEDFVAEGLLTEAEKDATVSTAGQSSCGSKK